MEEFSLPTRLFYGEEPLAALSELWGRRVFVVTDGFLAKSGLLERVRVRLGDRVTVFDEVTPDPSLELVARGVAALRKGEAEAVVAFGGGSPMDCAKAVRRFSGVDCPLWCTPTTAGTGSEVTSFAILTDTRQGVKHALVERSLLPDAAILAPEFLAGIPAAVTADTGMDVLAHGVEAWVAKGASPFSDAMALRAVQTAFDRLPAAFEGDGEAKGEMLLASCQAGMAFNAAGLGVCHALAHALGGAYHVPHGRINAILLPHVVLWHAKTCPHAAKKYAALAKACSLPATAQGLAAGLRRLARKLGEPEKFPKEMDIPAIVRVALEDRCAASDPGEVTGEALGAILEGVR